MLPRQLVEMRILLSPKLWIERRRGPHRLAPCRGVRRGRRDGRRRSRSFGAEGSRSRWARCRCRGARACGRTDPKPEPARGQVARSYRSQPSRPAPSARPRLCSSQVDAETAGRQATCGGAEIARHVGVGARGRRAVARPLLIEAAKVHRTVRPAQGARHMPRCACGRSVRGPVGP